jgi:hypothetical protein
LLNHGLPFGNSRLADRTFRTLFAGVMTTALSGFALDCQGIFQTLYKGQLAVTEPGVLALAADNANPGETMPGRVLNPC